MKRKTPRRRSASAKPVVARRRSGWSSQAQRSELRQQWERWLETKRRLEAELEHYKRLFEYAPNGHVTLDRVGVILDVNRAGAALLGATERQVIGKPILVFVARPDTNRLLQHLARCRAGSDAVATEISIGRGERTVPVQLLSRRVWLAGGHLVFHTAMTDISERLATEHAVRESEKRYRHIVETAGEGICMVDVDHRITFVNRRFASMVREAQELLLGRSVFDFVVVDHPGRARLEQFAELVRLGEVRLKPMDGTAFWAGVSTATMSDPTSDLAGFLLMFTDVTERKHLEAVRAQLVLRLVNAQEDERRRVALELHDQLGQYLTGLSLGLNRLEQLHTSQPDASELIRKLRQLADDMSRDAHHLAMELRPAALDDLGLSAAVSNYADEVARRSRLEVDVHCDLTVRLDPVIETTVYRVLQEALTNIVKHAKAKHVSIILERQDGGVRAIVEDDGVGFDVDQRAADPRAGARLGLVGMRERASVVGGELQIESRPGHGTTLFLRVPMKTQIRVNHEEAATAPRR